MLDHTLEKDVVDAVLEKIEKRNPDPASLQGLSTVEADLLGTITAVGIIGNGGHRYWYEGKNHLETEAVARSFERLGLPAVAAAMRDSLDVFPGRIATVDQPLSDAELDAAQARWEPLDRAVWDADWDRAALVYVLANAGALVEALPGVAGDLATLERAWALAARRLRDALADAAELDEPAVRRAIAANDHHAAHAALVGAGPRAGRALPFWQALRDVAEALRVRDHGVSVWQHRFLTEGYVEVDVEVVVANEHGVYILDSGPARWNAGVAARRFWSHRGDVHIHRVDEDARVHAHLYDRGRVRLVPMKPVGNGDPIAIHRKGTVIARGTVVEAVRPSDATGRA